MKKFATIRNLLLFLLFSSLLVLGVFFIPLRTPNSQNSLDQLSDAAADTLTRVEKKAARGEYFFKLMRDPATNRIPENIRSRELEFAKTLPSALQVKQRAKTKNALLKFQNHSWLAAGPTDLGGRTRALAVDQRNPDIILAGGVSGGMWKSTDGGDTWELKTPNLPNLSVTSVAQDPTEPDTWYYASGELSGLVNTPSANYSALYLGDGIYKSTDNGESWSLLPNASSNPSAGEENLVSKYNTVSRIKVHPVTGDVFIASTGFGIYRSTDGETFSDTPVLGAEGEQLFCDIDIADDGTIAAVISEASFDDQQSENSIHSHNPGIFISTTGSSGSWTEVTPSGFPDTYRRTVLAFAPSDNNILYALTLKGLNDTDNQGVGFFRINLGTGSWDDRSANLPDFRDSEDNGSGYMNLQGGYNMEVAVHPTDPDYVFIGGINLFRSDDGFATMPSGGYDGNDQSQKDRYWIGGYTKDNTFGLYENHHPDQHRVIFPQPSSNPNLMWSAHDGGLSYTTDVTASDVSWANQNNAYLTTQFYTTAIHPGKDSNLLMGGTQDNGTPFFEFNQSSTQSQDISSGDGGYAYFTPNYLFVSSQEGRLLRWEYDNSTLTALSYIYPSQAEGQLFIHPYAVDPNNESVIYYPENSHIWRNTEVDQIPNNNSSDGTTSGWEELESINLDGNIVTSLEVSQSPADILYFGGYNPNGQPVIKRLENARTSTDGAEDISLPSSSELTGAYIKDIAINPTNANEVIVVLSNYNITGLYHTIDGGQNWEPIEGNLTGTNSNPGPSLRSAAIIPAEDGTQYYVGGSTGLYSTPNLDGNNTQWGQEAGSEIGNAIVEHLSLRLSDGDLAVGTHGRGMFLGDFQGNTVAPTVSADPGEGRPGEVITLTATDFEFSPNPEDNIVTFGNEEALVLDATETQLEVEIPRNAISPTATSNSVNLTVRTPNNSVFSLFTILPPNNFGISQNYPNPFDGTTTIPFDLPADSRVTVQVFNTYGQKVREPIYQEDYNAGSYDAPVELSGLASGVYIYRVIAETQNGKTHMDSHKMTYIK